MTEYDLYNSPSFLHFSGEDSSNSDSNSSYKHLTKLANVSTSLKKRKPLFKAASSIRTNALRDNLMRAKLPLVASTPRSTPRANGMTFASELISPIALRRDSIINFNAPNTNNNNCTFKVVPRHRKSLKNIKRKKKKNKGIRTKAHSATQYDEKAMQTSKSLIDRKSQDECVASTAKAKLFESPVVIKNSFSERIQSTESPRSPFKPRNSISKIVPSPVLLSHCPSPRTPAGRENDNAIFKYPQKGQAQTVAAKSVIDNTNVKEEEVCKISNCLMEENSSKMPANESRTPPIPETCIERTPKKQKPDLDNIPAHLDSKLTVNSSGGSRHHTLEGSNLNPPSFINCSRMLTRQASPLLRDLSIVSSKPQDNRMSTKQTSRLLRDFSGVSSEPQDNRMPTRQTSRLLKDLSGVSSESQDNRMFTRQASLLLRDLLSSEPQDKDSRLESAHFKRPSSGMRTRRARRLMKDRSAVAENLPETLVIKTENSQAKRANNTKDQGKTEILERTECLSQTGNTIYTISDDDNDVKRDIANVSQGLPSKDLIDSRPPDEHESLPSRSIIQTRSMKKRATTQPSELGHDTNEFVIPTNKTKVPKKSTKRSCTGRATNVKKPPPGDASTDNTNEHVLLRQYIHTRKSGFVKLEKTEPSCTEVSTVNDTSRPRRSARPPRAFVQAMFVDSKHIEKLSSASTVSLCETSSRTRNPSNTIRSTTTRTTKVSITEDTTESDHANKTHLKKRGMETKIPFPHTITRTTRVSVSKDTTESDHASETHLKMETKIPLTLRKRHATKTNISPNSTIGNCKPSTSSHMLPEEETLPTSADYNIPASISETEVITLDTSVDNTIVPSEDNAGVGSDQNYNQNANMGPDHIMQAEVDHTSTPLPWNSVSSNLDTSQNISMTFCLTNSRYTCKSSCGFIQYGIGQTESSFPKNHPVIYMVKSGVAEVTQQFITKTFGVDACFYIPIGTPYKIRNISETETLVLFFTRIESHR